MKDLIAYTNEMFGEVRSMIIDGEPWFAAVDVCRVLEIENSRKATSKLDEDEKSVSIVHTLGGEQTVTIINEAGLYSLILTSRKPEAKQFKRWITHEVLPSLRKQGFYSMLTPEKLMEVLKEKQREDSTYLDAIDKQAIKRELVTERRNAGVDATRELWLKHFYEYDRATFIGELKRIWAGDVVMFHRYRDKYDKDERMKAKGGIVTF